jgi:hypothetical protein
MESYVSDMGPHSRISYGRSNRVNDEAICVKCYWTPVVKNPREWSWMRVRAESSCSECDAVLAIKDIMMVHDKIKNRQQRLRALDD